MKRNDSPSGIFDDQVLELAYQSVYALQFSKKTVAIYTFWKTFSLSLEKSGGISFEIVIDFDDVNHRNVIKALQRAVYDLQECGWVVDLGELRG